MSLPCCLFIYFQHAKHWFALVNTIKDIDKDKGNESSDDSPKAI